MSLVNDVCIVCVIEGRGAVSRHKQLVRYSTPLLGMAYCLA